MGIGRTGKSAACILHNFTPADVSGRKGSISDYPIPVHGNLMLIAHPILPECGSRPVGAENCGGPWLAFALAELEALEEGLISSNTERFIRSQLLWLKGDIGASNTSYLRFCQQREELDLLLAERQRRASEAGDAVAQRRLR